MKTKISRGYRQLSNGDLGTFASHVKVKVLNNEHFPNPTPAFPHYDEKLQAYEDACSKYEKGNKLSSLKRDEAKNELVELLDKLSNYVEIMANFEYSILLTTGFEMVKIPAPRPIPSIPIILAIEDGVKSGEVKIKIDCEGKSNSYSVEYSTTGSNSVTQHKFGETRKTMFVDGLEAGKYYSFRVAAANARGESDWSAAQTFLVR